MDFWPIESLTLDQMQAIGLSLRVAFLAMLASLPFALMVAYILARREFWGKGFLNILVHLPLFLPPVVTGYILQTLLGRHSILGVFFAKFGVQFAFHWAGAALAAGVMAFPLFVRTMRLGLEAVDPKLEQAAASLGASQFWIFTTITLPMILPSIIAGMILSFAKGFGEFGATITLVANIPGQTQTLPSAIYALLQIPGGQTGAVTLITISVLLAVGALSAAEVLGRYAARWVAGR
jgi:molybdate transport system permease protein